METKIEKADVIIEYLADKRIREILNLTLIKEHSALELSSELDTSLSTVYRRLKLLENCGLIRNIKTIINHAGNEEKYYRCAICEATVSFKNGKLSVNLKEKDYGDKSSRVWKRHANTNSRS